MLGYSGPTEGEQVGEGAPPGRGTGRKGAENVPSRSPAERKLRRMLEMEPGNESAITKECKSIGGQHVSPSYAQLVSK